MLRLTDGNDTFYVHPSHVVSVEEKGSGSQLVLSTDKKVDCDETPEEVALRIANTVSWYFRPRLTQAERDGVRELVHTWAEIP